MLTQNNSAEHIATASANDYCPAETEKKAQQFWQDNRSFDAKEEFDKEKYFCLSMMPYPSGDLHMGHVRNYTIGDVIARFMHLKGKNVLQPMAWDSFGLPAENAAIKRQLSPAEWTHKNIARMRKQLKSMGFAIDWRRELTTCEPSYYRWEQWLFLKMYEKGLVYKKEAAVNWDPVDQTTLANEQVINGRGWRSGALVEKRVIPQWFFKTTAYAEELLTGLDEMENWPEQVKTMQRNWIGRSEGVSIEFKIKGENTQTLTIYTTRPDTIYGATYISIAPDHPLAKKAAKANAEVKAFIEACSHVSTAEAEIAHQEKHGIDTGLKAINPFNKKNIPIWITNFVLMDYGTGAIMSVPAHDERDHEMAIKYNLPIIPVIKPHDESEWDYLKAAFTDTGIMMDSDDYNGHSSTDTKKNIILAIAKKKLGKAQINYRLRDWGISRQRYWGTPIPMIFCKNCGDIPVPEDQLPVILPNDLIPDGKASPLKACRSFYQTKCPQCGGQAKRETDTMDTFVESSWYYARFSCFDQGNKILDDRAKYWTPVDQYIGGIEHAVLHLLYARFMHKVLRDLGLLNTNEPFSSLLTQGMVLKDGHKMAKSKGNVVAPQALIKQYGADTVRLFSMFAAPPEHSLEWSDSAVEGCYRFLRKLWTLATEKKSLVEKINQQPKQDPFVYNDNESFQKQRCEFYQLVKQAKFDIKRFQFNTVVSTCMKLCNLLHGLETSSEAIAHLFHEGMRILLQILSPITPHICHELWRELGYGEDILTSEWPKMDNRALKTSSIEIIVQINGKLRAKIQALNEASKEEIEKQALAHDVIQKYIKDKTVKKVIVVPNKLVNIVAV
ncbi:MAG: leucine--tRNA ligase [Gammaproteobacteria bacterium RIFCSPHIGHO2_12_FULL_41_15]|nr:MAG: leucine--tRNA ligase [Gammaproteobacteria bacterium RIFCSPHIGHO2_12_FULL_41_15]